MKKALLILFAAILIAAVSVSAFAQVRMDVISEDLAEKLESLSDEDEIEVILYSDNFSFGKLQRIIRKIDVKDENILLLEKGADYSRLVLSKKQIFEASLLEEVSDICSVDDAFLTDLFYGVAVFIGDTDGDREISILDATVIQRVMAELQVPAGDYDDKAADADEDGEVSILDATAIQRYIAKLPTNSDIGTYVGLWKYENQL